MHNKSIHQKAHIFCTFCKKIPIAMRMTLLFLFLLVFHLQAEHSYSQNTKISLDMKNSSIERILQVIEERSEYYFLYNSKLIDVDRKTDIRAEEESIASVLNRLFGTENVSYEVKGTQIILHPKEMNRIASELMANMSQQQKKQIAGKITDERGEPIIGVNIIEKGTTNGTVTDIEGNFSFRVEEDAVLQISYIGYLGQEISTAGRTSVNVILQEDTKVLEEVVVTALGIKRAEKALSYNVQTIKSEDVTAVKNTNFINALAGKVAGVTINAGSSGMGGASKVVMRGAKSIAQSNNALYVIDGIPTYNTKGEGDSGSFASNGTTEAIADINPEDIESISVLTGAAAAALYGNQGANGAIVITTKRGTAGKLEVLYTSSAENFSPLVLPRFQSRYGTGDISSSGGSSIKSWGRKLVPENSYGFDPRKDFFETGTAFTNSISVSNGTEKNQTYFSAAAVNTDAIIPNTHYDRYNFTFRNTSKFLNDKIILDIGGSYIIQKDQNMRNQGVYSNPVTSAYLFPRGDDFNMIRVFERFDPVRNINVQYWPQGEGDFRLQNPYWIAYRNLNNNDRKRYMFHANLSYDILDWLNIAGRVRIDNSDNDNTQKSYATTNAVFSGPNGQYLIARSHDRNTYADVLVNINKYFDDFSVKVNTGASISDINYDNLNVNGPIREDGIPNIFNVFQLDKDKKREEQDGWRQMSQAIFASAEVGYKNAYYLTLTSRNDWESTLANTERLSFFYPSAGFSTVLSEVLSLPKQISYLKARASFAQVGTPIPRHISLQTYSWDAGTGSWATATIYPIRVFKPESTNSWEVGLTANFLRQFRFDFSWYKTNTFNQTFEPQLSVSSGYSTIYMQTGNVQNTGIETRLNYTNEWSGLAWSSTAIFSLNRNKIVELVKDTPHPETGEIINKDRLNVGGLGRASFILKTGGNLGDLWTTSDLVRDSNGKIYIDENGYPLPNFNADDIYLGSVFPKSNVSWRNDFSWRNMNLSFMLSARFGGVVFSGTQAALDLYGVSEATAEARDRGYVIINGEDRIDPQAWYTTIGASDGIASYYTYSATNIRLQECSIAYNIPRSRLGNTVDLTVSLVAHNLWMIYNKAPFDPESVASTGNYFQGMDNFIMPSLRSIGLNLKIKFLK
jgi:TonB-linked outer membrane protein, SusC/RagA family/TonB-dependent outer membrane receptor, SusC/RagA subfamily, signature region